MCLHIYSFLPLILFVLCFLGCISEKKSFHRWERTKPAVVEICAKYYFNKLTEKLQLEQADAVRVEICVMCTFRLDGFKVESKVTTVFKIKHHARKTFRGVEVYLHAFLTLALHGDEWLHAVTHPTRGPYFGNPCTRPLHVRHAAEPARGCLLSFVSLTAVTVFVCNFLVLMHVILFRSLVRLLECFYSRIEIRA